ncbi:MAG: glycosyltransferase family 2 protein [Clostridiales bacterium]|nr:glycosyltransferase family 2 protein [Clostridiales bacterium]MDY4172758.1 glycosyltransferase family 2 protein [Evtepia sp.]
MDIILTINIVIAVIFTVCYAYQMFFLLVPFTKKQEPHKPEVLHRFAILICARNEEAVIADLIQSIRHQTYDQSLLTVFVMADNCTDATADIARREGAVVYTRFNKEKVGKGYALEQLLLHIEEDYPKSFDGFFVFDADNVLDRRFVEEMNRTFSDGYEVVTSYRNSKNYGDNWISAGYALWFIRESRYLNNSRMLLGTSCAVSGTGFLFSRQVLESTNGWKFHLLTEDIEFSVHHILQGRKIGFCAGAVLYDEQPVTFRQSWRQRLRWARGFLQVFRKYGFGLLKGVGKGHFSCYDMSMTIMPAYVLTMSLIILYLVGGFVSGTGHVSFLPCLRYIIQTVLGLYTILFLVGAFTTATEWDQIHTTPRRKVLYTFTFPLFMLTYIPISLVALFSRKVQWKPIEHHRADQTVLEAAAGRK